MLEKERVRSTTGGGLPSVPWRLVDRGRRDRLFQRCFIAAAVLVELLWLGLMGYILVRSL